jgi:hypothetical protein
MWNAYVEPVSVVRALFQTLESLEPTSTTDRASLEAEIWEAFEHKIFPNKSTNQSQRSISL